MLRVVLTGWTLLATTASVVAAPDVKKAHPPAAIDISNQRKIALTEFVLSLPGDAGKTVAQLKKPLAPGDKIRIKIAGAKGCEYVARWKFDDLGDQAPVDLCNDPRIILTD